jgi:RNA ligase (TIGR02306 family)
MTDRKMATVRRIAEILPIPDADAIELAVVDGWKVVVKKNEFVVNDYIVYCEIDSWIPTEIASFLSKGKEPREYNGVKGERLRTVKLRNTMSQGLLLKLEDCFNIIEIEGKKYINKSEYNKVARTEDVYIQNNKQDQ